MSKDRKASRPPRTRSGMDRAVLGKRSWIDTEAGSEPLRPAVGVALTTVGVEEPALTQLVEGPGSYAIVNITTTGRIATSLTLSNPSPATDLRDVLPEEDCSSHRNLSAFRPAILKAASLTPCVRPRRANIYTESFHLSVLFSTHAGRHVLSAPLYT